jgi:hypothetical protein
VLVDKSLLSSEMEDSAKLQLQNVHPSARLTTDVDGISTSLEISVGIPRIVSTRFEKRIPGRLGILVRPRT